MSSSATIARHRAPAQPTALSSIAKAVSSNAGSMGRQAAVVAAASGMVLVTGVSATAAQGDVNREASAASDLQIQTASAVQVSASAAAKVSFDRPDVRSTPAPVVEAQEPVVAPQSDDVKPAVAPAETATPAQSQAATAAVTADTTGTASTQAAAKPTPEPVQQKAPSSSGIAAGIASAAYAQLGVGQDCTMLVTNALAAVGINHHGWPDSYFSLGSQVSASQAQPGDLVYYADGGMGLAHIAVYVGNGKAVHGGWDGGSTVLESVNVGSGPVYIRVNG